MTCFPFHANSSAGQYTKIAGLIKSYLNPAPFTEDVRTWPLELVDTLIVNETEAAGLSGAATASGHSAIEAILRQLAELYSSTEIVLTAGRQGAYFARGTQEPIHVPAVEAAELDR